jgi:hypothetical protein
VVQSQHAPIVLRDPISKITQPGGVAQGIVPEFKPQYQGGKKKDQKDKYSFVHT